MDNANLLKEIAFAGGRACTLRTDRPPRNNAGCAGPGLRRSLAATSEATLKANLMGRTGSCARFGRRGRVEVPDPEHRIRYRAGAVSFTRPAQVNGRCRAGAFIDLRGTDLASADPRRPNSKRET